jgi:hypothetical protein
MAYRRLFSEETSSEPRRNKAGRRRVETNHDFVIEELVRRAAERVKAERAGKAPEASKAPTPAPTPTRPPIVAPRPAQGPSATITEAPPPPAVEKEPGEWAKAKKERARKAVLAKLAKAAKEEEG